MTDDATFTFSVPPTAFVQLGDRLEIHQSPSCEMISIRVESGWKTIASISFYKFWQNPKSYFAWKGRRIKTWFMRRIMRRKDYGTYIVTSSEVASHGLAREVKMRSSDAEVRI